MMIHSILCISLFSRGPILKLFTESAEGICGVEIIMPIMIKKVYRDSALREKLIQQQRE
jgi:hypothetical protein